MLNHRGFQMANRPSLDLLHRGVTPRQAHRFIFGGEIPDERRHATVGMK
jgi:hypothetical protein